MAARKKTTSSRKKTAPRAKKGSAARGKSAAKGAAKASRGAGAKKTAAKSAGPSGLVAVAQKIVRATLNPQKFSIQDLYTADCESVEATGDTARGHDGIQKKLEQWEQMQSGTKWNARHTLIGKNVIIIEWDAEVSLRDGRTVQLPEIAVHEIKNGKIARERFYYNPMAFMPAGGQA